MATWERIALRAEAEIKRLNKELATLQKLVPIAEKVLAQADATCEAGKLSAALDAGIKVADIMKFREILDKIRKE